MCWVRTLTLPLDLFVGDEEFGWNEKIGNLSAECVCEMVPSSREVLR